MPSIIDYLLHHPFRWRNTPAVIILEIIFYLWMRKQLPKYSWLPPIFNSNAFIIITLFALLIIYLVLCYFCTRLPRAPKNTPSVLFVIDTATPQLYDEAKYRLVNSFEDFSSRENASALSAICVPKESLKKYNLKDDKEKITLLNKVRCTVMIFVKYDADSYTNAENYQMTIRCGVKYPDFSSSKSKILINDMNALSPSLRKKSFSKAQTMDTFNFTSQTLSFVCQYIIGLLYLLSNMIDAAQTSLSSLYQQLAGTAYSSDYTVSELSTILRLTKRRLYTTFLINALLSINKFEDTKVSSNLASAELLLNKALSLFPNSSDANLGMAYIAIALYGDSKRAKTYVSNAKIAHADTSFDEAFLNAYDNAPPTLIISSYKRAFANDKSSNIVKLIDFCEYVIDKEPYRFSLHLAVGLQYEFLGDYTLMHDHFTTYLSHLENIPPNIQRILNAKSKLLLTK